MFVHGTREGLIGFFWSSDTLAPIISFRYQNRKLPSKCKKPKIFREKIAIDLDMYNVHAVHGDQEGQKREMNEEDFFIRVHLTLITCSS